MANYQIVTDSCCDLTREQYARMDIAWVPLTLLYRGQSVDSFTEPGELRDFYGSIRQGQMPTTSAVNPEGWANVMEPHLAQGRDILCLTFTSGLSATHQSARIAAVELQEKYPHRKILVVDSLCAALGQGLLVTLACHLRDRGSTLEELADWLEKNKLHLCHWFTVNDLEYLKRGGRISAATALVGGMLNIKPVLRLDDQGRLENMAKARGRKAALEALAVKLAQNITDCDTIAIGHGDCPEDAALLEKLCREKCPGIREVITGYVGGVIGAHTGPGVLALFFLGKGR